MAPPRSPSRPSPTCGPAAPARPPRRRRRAHAEASAAPAGGVTKADEAPKPEAAAPSSGSTSPAESLAHDLFKTGGRRIGWSAAKKRFIVPVEVRTSTGRSLDLRVNDDEPQQRENQQVCQLGVCEDRLDELAREKLPKLVAFLEQNGLEAVGAIEQTSMRDEIDVGTLGGKLRYEKGRLSLALEKKVAALRPQGGRSPRSATISAVYPVPAAKPRRVCSRATRSSTCSSCPDSRGPRRCAAAARAQAAASTAPVSQLVRQVSPSSPGKMT